MADVSAIMSPKLMLADYLASLCSRCWKPGVLDCAILMADWATLRGIRDPILDLRGTYSSEKGFLRILRREGGFVASCTARLERVGLLETSRISAGDLAVVLAPYAQRNGKVQRRPTGAICVDQQRRAIATSDIGIVIASEKELPLIKAWTF